MKRNFEVFFFKSRQSSVVYIQELVNTSTFYASGARHSSRLMFNNKESLASV